MGKISTRVELIRPFLSCRGLQPTGLICHVEAFQVTMPVDEDPSQVADLPVLPSTGPVCASHIRPLDIVQSDSDARR